MEGSIIVSYGNGYPSEEAAVATFMSSIMRSKNLEARPISIYLKDMPEQIEWIQNCLEADPKCVFQIIKASEFGLTLYYAVPRSRLSEETVNPDTVAYGKGVVMQVPEPFFGDGFYFIPFSNIAAISTRTK